MDEEEIVIKQTEKSIHEQPLEEQTGYADRADDDLRSRIGDYGMGAHFEELLESHTRSGAVLDLACGRAPWADDPLDRSPNLRWVGIDLSERRIAETTARIDDPNAFFLVGDAERLPFESDAFDTVVSSAALHHLPNWDDRALDELVRVMKDDGVLIFREPLKYNPLAYTFRRLSPGPCHTPYEHPFPYYSFKRTMQARFEEVDIRAHHVVCLLVPLLSGVVGLRLPLGPAKALYDVEQRFLKGPLKELGMHMTGIAKRPV